MGATVDHRDGVLDDPEAAAGDVRIRAHRWPLERLRVNIGLTKENADLRDELLRRRPASAHGLQPQRKSDLEAR
jgi:hypothetical protein